MKANYMEKLKMEFKRLKSQLVNEGEERSTSEVMWNETILEAMDNLFEEVNEETEKQIRLNLTD